MFSDLLILRSADSEEFFAFFIVTPLSNTGRSEPLTELPILKPSAGAPIAKTDNPDLTNQDIIGLTHLTAELHWMVPFNPVDRQMITTSAEIAGDSELLHVNWRLHFG